MLFALAADKARGAGHNVSTPASGQGIHLVKITAVELRQINLPLIYPFETSFGRTTERHIPLVRVIDEYGGEGWGECVAGEGPFYSNEWVEQHGPRSKHIWRHS